jgi:hypothetical protein
MRWHPLRSVRRRRELNSSAPFANKRTQQVCHTTLLVYACAATYVSSYCIRCVMVLVQVCHATSLQVCHNTSLCMCWYVRVLILDYILLHTCPHAALYAATYVSACCTMCHTAVYVCSHTAGGASRTRFRRAMRHAPTKAGGARRRGRVTVYTGAGEALLQLCCSSVRLVPRILLCVWRLPTSIHAAHTHTHTHMYIYNIYTCNTYIYMYM